jgi:hypothetical protein
MKRFCPRYTLQFGPLEFCQLSCAVRWRRNPANSLQCELGLSPAHAMDARYCSQMATNCDWLRSRLLTKAAARTARMSHRGQWADPNFAPLQSENIARIAAARGQFVLVEGKVLSVHENGVTIIFESRTALDPRLYRHYFKASPAGIRRRGHRSETAGGSSNSGVRLDRTVQRSRDRSRGA